MTNHSMCKTETAKRLLSEIEKIQIIDAHEHLPTEQQRLEWGADALTFFSHYCRGDLTAAGMKEEDLRFFLSSNSASLAERWQRFKPYYKKIENSAYVKSAHIALERFYGEAELTDGNIDKVTEDIKAAGKPGLYKKVLRDACNIYTCLNQAPSKSEDGLLTPVIWHLGFCKISAGTIAEHAELLGREVKNVDDLLEAAERHVVENKNKGGVGYKLLVFPMKRPDFQGAKDIFAELQADKETVLSGGNALYDLYIDTIFKALEKHDLAACVHTGYWRDFRDLHPAHIIDMADHYPNVNFDMYHVGYPYVREAIMLGKSRHNIWMNMCWTYIISPHFAGLALTEMLEMIPNHKIIGFGGDYSVVEKVYGHLVLARQVIANALAAKVEDGWFTYDQAVDMAKKMLFDNPKELYKL